MKAALSLTLIVYLVASALPVTAQPLQSFENLALRVNLDDRLRVEDQAGVTATGRLTRLTRDDLTIQTDAGEKHFSRDKVREVAARVGLAIGAFIPQMKTIYRAGEHAVLIGAGAGAALGAVVACTGADRSECVDGPLMLGAGLGLAVGALIHRTTVVYPEPEKRTEVSRAIWRNAAGIWISRRW